MLPSELADSQMVPGDSRNTNEKAVGSISLVSHVFGVPVMCQQSCDVGCLHGDVVVNKRVVENGEIVALNTQERYTERGSASESLTADRCAS